MTTVTRGAPQGDIGALGSTEKALIGALVVVTLTAILATLWIALASGPAIASIAPVAIPVIGTVAASSVGGIVVALRRRSAKARR